MRSSLFGLRPGTNSTLGSPSTRPDSGILDVLEPLSLPPSAAPGPAAPSPPPTPRSRPLTRLAGGLTPFRKASPAPTPKESPALGPIATNGTASVTYLDSLSLRLGEAVNKALMLPMAGTVPKPVGTVDLDPVLKGRRPLPAGRGRALGALISSELNHASNVLHDTFLHRAILRLLQRPLTVLITNLTQQLTQLLLSPDFPPVPSSLPTLNATQVHAIALAHFCSEVLETFDALNLGAPARAGHGDTLKAIKDGLENVVTKVVGPFISAIKSELVSSTNGLEKESSAHVFERSLVRLGPLIGRITFSGECGQSMHIQSLLATLEIGIIWNALVSLSNRHLPRIVTPNPNAHRNSPSPRSESPAPSLRRTVSEGKLYNGSTEEDLGCHIPLPSYVTPPDTPQVVPKDKEREREPKKMQSSLTFSSSILKITPPSTKKISFASLKPLSRAPSPPTVKAASPVEEPKTQTPPSVIALAKETGVVSMALKTHLPLPFDGTLAKEAVDEAFKELHGFVGFTEHIPSALFPPTHLPSLNEKHHPHTHPEVNVESLLTSSRPAPMLLTLPLLLRLNIDLTVAQCIGLEEEEYRRGCLCGFAKADKCAAIVGKALLRGRVLRGGWMREWLERSVREEEESSSESEGEDE